VSRAYRAGLQVLLALTLDFWGRFRGRAMMGSGSL
jgi:hypothetical protein